MNNQPEQPTVKTNNITSSAFYKPSYFSSLSGQVSPSGETINPCQSLSTSFHPHYSKNPSIKGLSPVKSHRSALDNSSQTIQKPSGSPQNKAPQANSSGPSQPASNSNPPSGQDMLKKTAIISSSSTHLLSRRLPVLNQLKTISTQAGEILKDKRSFKKKFEQVFSSSNGDIRPNMSNTSHMVKTLRSEISAKHLGPSPKHTTSQNLVDLKSQQKHQLVDELIARNKKTIRDVLRNGSGRHIQVKRRNSDSDTREIKVSKGSQELKDHHVSSRCRTQVYQPNPQENSSQYLQLPGLHSKAFETSEDKIENQDAVLLTNIDLFQRSQTPVSQRGFSPSLHWHEQEFSLASPRGDFSNLSNSNLILMDRLRKEPKKDDLTPIENENQGGSWSPTRSKVQYDKKGLPSIVPSSIDESLFPQNIAEIELLLKTIYQPEQKNTSKGVTLFGSSDGLSAYQPKNRLGPLPELSFELIEAYDFLQKDYKSRQPKYLSHLKRIDKILDEKEKLKKESEMVDNDNKDNAKKEPTPTPSIKEPLSALSSLPPFHLSKTPSLCPPLADLSSPSLAGLRKDWKAKISNDRKDALTLMTWYTSMKTTLSAPNTSTTPSPSLSSSVPPFYSLLLYTLSSALSLLSSKSSTFSFLLHCLFTDLLSLFNNIQGEISKYLSNIEQIRQEEYLEVMKDWEGRFEEAQLKEDMLKEEIRLKEEYLRGKEEVLAVMRSRLYNDVVVHRNLREEINFTEEKLSVIEEENRKVSRIISEYSETINEDLYDYYEKDDLNPLKEAAQNIQQIQKRTDNQLFGIKTSQKEKRALALKVLKKIKEADKNALMNSLDIGDQEEYQKLLNFETAEASVDTSDLLQTRTINVEFEPIPKKIANVGIQKDLPKPKPGVNRWTQIGANGVSEHPSMINFDLDSNCLTPGRGNAGISARPSIRILNSIDGKENALDHHIIDICEDDDLFLPSQADMNFQDMAGSRDNSSPSPTNENAKSSVDIDASQSPDHRSFFLEPKRPLHKLPSGVFEDRPQLNVPRKSITLKGLNEVADYFERALLVKSGEDLQKDRNSLKKVIRKLDEFIEFNKANLSKFDKELLEQRKRILEQVEKKMIDFSEIQTKFYQATYEKDHPKKNMLSSRDIFDRNEKTEKVEVQVVNKIKSKNNQLISEANKYLRTTLIKNRDGKITKHESISTAKVSSILNAMTKVYMEYAGLFEKAKKAKKQFPSVPLPVFFYKHLTMQISNKETATRNYQIYLERIIKYSSLPALDLFGRFLGLTGSYDHRCFQIFIELLTFYRKSA